MTSSVLVKMALPRALEVMELGEEMKPQTAMGWFTGIEVYGPAPRSTCEAAAANVDSETHMFAVAEVHSLDELTTLTGGSA